MTPYPVLSLTLYLMLLAFVSVGGFLTTVPELHRYVVDVQNWMTSETFVTLYALAQVAPGPNMIIVTLVGWEVGGVLGAICATLATCVPMFCISYGVSRITSGLRGTSTYRIVERGVAPFTLGLILTTGLILAMGASEHWSGYAVTALTVAFLLATGRSPFLPLGIAAAAGYFGLV